MRGPDDLDRAFDQLTQVGVDALYVVSSRPTVASVAPIVGFGTTKKLPVVGGWGTWAEGGALISYGPNVLEITRQSAAYVDRILNGANLPTFQHNNRHDSELVVNLRTANELRIAIPESFLLQADQVIE